MELSNSKITKFLIFSQKKAVLIFQEAETQKILYVSVNGTFLCFRKGIFRTLAYLELEAYSEPKQYSVHCQTATMEHSAKIAT